MRTEQNITFYLNHYKYREYTYYQRIHIFSDPQLILSRSIVAALANALQPSSPIYHVSYHRVSYVTQLSLFNDGGRGGIGLRIGRNLRAKPRPPVVSVASTERRSPRDPISACVLIRSHPPAHAHRPTNNRRVCSLLRLALCVLLPLIATALTSNYRRRMWCVYQLIRARIQGDARTLPLMWISTLLTLLLRV